MADKWENFWRVHALTVQEFEADKQGWLQVELWSFSWWVLVLFLILPWILWLRIVDRKRILEISFFGTLIIIVTTLADVIGNELGLWGYPTQLIPIAPRAFAFDFSMVPVGFMVLYQFFRVWRPFLIALFCMALLYAFVGEPLAVWLELVHYMKWSYLFSFLYYIVVGVGARALVERLKVLSRT